ncbi:hypothetical protein [Thermoanaerobacterium thermosaccharolyticum]|uniref:Uncharacterized protein n=2 Tax=Thermoanaerobacterium thermosaccharolyticum TaxID=1517 RepID=A0A223HWS8_THETR|nr:hypothetical protein [Thermoanaerobacterium thermosaccharolyticum]AGB19898.1 hypothetical protein Thethe_02328 [Thermoanaerobacterium thermosaccharolyticum M0795]AST56918.1 hypothetical protein Thert_00764 [Thermoanaerobacterium thermosaccharolyticum]
MTKGKKILAVTLMSAMLISTVAFADEVASPQQSSSNTTLQTAPNKVDPIQRLESIKAKVTQKYNEGKISKNKYDSIIAKINNMEQQINDFNKLTLDQKRQKLISDYTAAVNKKVQNGKITQDKANELIKNYTDKVNKWDGTGFPPGMKGMFMGFKNFNGGAYKRFENALDKAVKDNKITESQKQDILNYFKGNKDKSGSTSSTTTQSNS